MINLEDKKQRIATIAKWGIAAGVALIVAPIIFMVVKGIVGLALAGILGLAVINFAPVLSMKFANWKVMAIKAEAGENPIETLENLLLAMVAAFKTAETDVTAGVAARNTFGQKVRQFAKAYPARAPEFEAQLKTMDGVMTRKIAALKQAQTAVETAEHKLEEMRAYWDMAQALQAANKAVKMDTGDLYAKMKHDTAVDAVFASMSQAFAELEVSASLDVSAGAPALEYQPRDTSLDDLTSSLLTPQPVKVLAK